MLADKSLLESLLEYIGNRLKHEINCMLIGGNAMLYYNLRGQTKDLDIVLFKKEDLGTLIKIINSHPLYRGVRKTRKLPYYVRPPLRKKGTPIFIGTKDIPRFDLFYKYVFSINAEQIFNNSERSLVFGALKIRLPKPEYLIFLKASVMRPQDREDIIKLVKSFDIDWNKFLNIMESYIKESEKAVYFAFENLHNMNKEEKVIPDKVIEKSAKLFDLEL